MIDALDETIRQLLIREMPITDNEIDIAFDQPKREWSARLSRPTINLFLYDIRENAALRKFGWETTSITETSIGRKMAPLRVDCHYIVSAWANDSSDEHRLIARTMMALFRYPDITRDMLVDRLRSQAFDIRTRLASHDKLTNPAEVWSALDNEMRPSISYIITLTMDPWSEEIDPIVNTVSFGTTQTQPDEQSKQATATHRDSLLASIGGLVRRAGKPVVGAQVAIQGTGIATVTDLDGRYQLRGIRLGEHTLLVTPTQGTAATRPITIPDAINGYDVNLEGEK